MSLLITCSYCNAITDAHDITREHLIPRSWGGVKTILVCSDCNMKRGTSFRYGPFLKFIRENSDLYRAHIEHSKTSPTQRQYLMSLVREVESTREPVDWYQTLCKEMFEKLRTAEAIDQMNALNMAKSGTPIKGGRAAKAVLREHKKKIRGKFRRDTKVALERYIKEKS